MTDVAEEHCLGAIELCECLGPLADMLFGAGTGDRGLEVVCHELVKSPRLLQRPHRIHAHDEDGGQVLAAGIQHGKRQSLLGRDFRDN